MSVAYLVIGLLQSENGFIPKLKTQVQMKPLNQIQCNEIHILIF